MARILVVATSRKTRGGITAVIKTYESCPIWSKYHCHWVQTHRDGSIFRKIYYLTTAWLDFLVRVPFYDIVHVHISLQTTVKRKKPFVRIAKALGKKVIVHLHCGDQIDMIWNKDYDYMFRAADVSVFLSDNLRRMVEAHTGKGRDYRVLYNPCPFIENGIEQDRKKYILFSGTLSEGKGYLDLINAFGRIAEKHLDWRIILVGNGDIDKGRATVERCGITRQAVFPGWVSGKVKDRYFREAAIFCLPSYAEGFPMAVLDAWAYGIPVVTTPVGGIPDVAIDEYNMLLFAPGDVEKLAEQLEKIIVSFEGDKILYNRIKSASLDFAKNKFNVNTINAQIGDLYEELV